MAKMISHQDRGSVYTGADYMHTVMEEKCRLSYSRRGEPGDNAVNKSFFRGSRNNDVMFSMRNRALINYKKYCTG